jgi:hypothetical protein
MPKVLKIYISRTDMEFRPIIVINAMDGVSALGPGVEQVSQTGFPSGRKK